jgi:hypothetical protein
MITMKPALIPRSLLFSLIGILFIPAIAYGSLHFMLPSSPDLIYTSHGKLKIEWVKLSENDEFTEYVSKEKHFEEDQQKGQILFLRDYKEPQVSIHEHNKVVYSSVVLHQTINCVNRTTTVDDILMFSKARAKGLMVKDLYDLEWDSGQVKAGSLSEKKVSSLCSFNS